MDLSEILRVCRAWHKLQFWGQSGRNPAFWITLKFSLPLRKGGIREPLAKRQCIQSCFLGHIELGNCGKCNYSLKRVGEIYITI